jgi:PAS domain-containing protein
MNQHPRESVPAAQLQALIDILAGPAACFDGGSGRIRFCNAAWRSRFGSPPPSCTWRDVFGPDDESSVACMREATGAGASFERLLAGPGRAPRWHRGEVQSVRGDDGDGLICTCVDIDDLRKSASRLEARDVLQAGMLDLTQDCIKIISPEGMLVMMNRAGCRALGLPVDSPLGMEWLPLLGERSRARAKRRWRPRATALRRASSATAPTAAVLARGTTH